MKNKKKGISLITLVITIIVIVVLAAAVVLALSRNNPIENAKEATFKSDVKNLQEQFYFNRYRFKLFFRSFIDAGNRI